MPSGSLVGLDPGLRSADDYRVPGVDDATTFERMVAGRQGGVITVNPGVWSMPRTPSWMDAANVEVWVLPGVTRIGGGAWPTPSNGNFVRFEVLGATLAYASRVMPAGPQSIPASVETPLSFGNPALVARCYDTGGFWSIGHPTRLTAPATGIYHVSAALGLVASSVGVRRELFVRVNGGDLLVHLVAEAAPSASIPWLAIGSADVQLAAGDYLELAALHDAALVTGMAAPLNVGPLNAGGALNRGTSTPIGLSTLSGSTDTPALSVHYLGALQP